MPQLQPRRRKSSRTPVQPVAWLCLAILTISAQAAGRVGLASGVDLHGRLDHPIRVIRPATDSSARLLAIQIARTGHVALGFEEAEERLTPRADEPASRELPAVTVEQGLSDLVWMDPRYQWRVVDGAIVIRPTRAWHDKANALNHRVPHLEWRDRSAMRALTGIVALLGLGVMAESSVSPGDRLFSVSVGPGSLVDVMNACVEAHGHLGWLVRYRDEDFDEAAPGHKTRFEVGFIGLDRSGNMILTFETRPRT